MPSKKTSKANNRETSEKPDDREERIAIKSEIQELYINEERLKALKNGTAKLIPTCGIMSYEEDGTKWYTSFPDEFIEEIAKKIEEGKHPIVKLKMDKEGITAVIDEEKTPVQANLIREEKKPNKTDKSTDYQIYS